MPVRKSVSFYVHVENAAFIQQTFLIYHTGEFYHDTSRKGKDMDKLKYVQKIYIS